MIVEFEHGNYFSVALLRAEHLEELKARIERSGPKLALDLEEVSLMDVDVVRFRGICQGKDIELLHCSAYIGSPENGRAKSCASAIARCQRFDSQVMKGRHCSFSNRREWLMQRA
jgi:hypothetical protein